MFKVLKIYIMVIKHHLILFIITQRKKCYPKANFVKILG